MPLATAAQLTIIVIQHSQPMAKPQVGPNSVCAYSAGPPARSTRSHSAVISKCGETG